LNRYAPPVHCSLLILLGGFILAGCATMHPGFEEPDVTVSYLRPLPGAGAVPQFEMGLRVLNPNNTALELTGISYTVNIEGNKLITGVGNDLPVIEAYSEAEFKLTAAVSLFGGIQLMRELMGRPKQRSLMSSKRNWIPVHCNLRFASRKRVSSHCSLHRKYIKN
jgi:hypothetical protein